MCPVFPVEFCGTNNKFWQQTASVHRIHGSQFAALYGTERLNFSISKLVYFCCICRLLCVRFVYKEQEFRRGGPKGYMLTKCKHMPPFYNYKSLSFMACEMPKIFKGFRIVLVLSKLPFQSHLLSLHVNKHTQDFWENKEIAPRRKANPNILYLESVISLEELETFIEIEEQK